MTDIVLRLAVFAVVIAVGWALVRADGVPAGSDTILTRVCFYAATPALMVTTIGSADLATVLSRQSLAGLLAETAGILSAFALHRWVLRRPLGQAVIGALAAGYVNSANLGIPVLIVLLGDATAIAPILLIQLLVLSPLAFALLDVDEARRAQAVQAVRAARGSGAGGAGGGGEDGGPSGGRGRLAVWTAPLRNPLLIGVLAGLAVNLAHLRIQTWLGGLVLNSLDTLSALAVTVMMLSLGMSLAAGSPHVRHRLSVTRVERITQARVQDGAGSGGGATGAGQGEGTAARTTVQEEAGDQDTSRHDAALWVSVLWKLLLVPLTAAALGWVLGLRGAALLVPVTTAALPCAQNVFMYATRYQVAKALARDSVLWTTALFVPVELLAAAVLT